MINALRYISSIKYPFQAESFKKKEGHCDACGDEASFEYFDVINDRLASEWKINKSLQHAYSVRESMHCSSCRCSVRLRALARAITLVFDPRSKSLMESIKKGVFKSKNVAEINACGDLHEILKKIKSLEYSEYAGRVKGVRDEDLQNLTYKDNAFDLILTSDTFEHVPDYQKALTEIYRILKPGGYHIYTLPLIFSRKTKRRVKIYRDKLEMIARPSYHGAGEEDNLVCTEFGIDFMNELKKSNFRTNIYFGNPVNMNEVCYVLVSRKV